MACLICHKDDPSNPEFHLSTWTTVICRLLEIPESNLDKIFKKNSTTSTNAMWICTDCNGRLIEGHRLLDLVEDLRVKLSKIKNDILNLLKLSSKSSNDYDTFDDQSSQTKREDGYLEANLSSCQDLDDPVDDYFNDYFDDGPLGLEEPASHFNCLTLTKEVRIILEPIQVPHSFAEDQTLYSVNINDQVISNFIKRDQKRINKFKSTTKSRTNDKSKSIQQIVQVKSKKGTNTSVRKTVNNSAGSKSQKAKLKEHHQNHIKSKSKPRKFNKNLTCLQCNITYKNRGSLSTHNKYKHSKADLPSFICDHCGKSFLREIYLRFHLRSHGIGTGVIQCAFCSKFLKSPRLYKRHMAHAHGEGDNKTLLCELCPAKFSTKLTYEDHKMCQHLGQKYTCKRCDKTFTTQGAVAIHIKRIHEKDYKFFCPETGCKKSFVTNGEMKSHFNVVHQGIKRFSCTEPNCDKKFSMKYRLLLHIKNAHSSEKAFKCLTCFKEFSSSDGFKRHNLLHLGVRDHTCTICGESYTLKSSLNQHIIERHEGKKVLHPDVNKRKKFVRRCRVLVVEPNGQDT